MVEKKKKATRRRKGKEAAEPGKARQRSYFSQKSQSVDFISSGCKTLDCVLGGGWPIGRVANIVGDKSTGKCVEHGYVLTSHGMFRIEDLCAEAPSGESHAIQKGLSTAVRRGQESGPTHIYSEEVHQLYRFKTRHGFEIAVTPDHPLAVWNQDCEIEMVAAKDIKDSDFLILASNTEMFPDPVFDLIGPSTAELMGFLMGSGQIPSPHDEVVTIRTSRQHVVNRIIDDVDNKSAYNIVDRWEDGDDIILSFGNPRVAQSLCKFIGRAYGEAGDVEIPESVRYSGKEVVRKWLKGFMESRAELDGNAIVVKTDCHDLAEQLHLMLLNFGILSKRTSSDKGVIHHIRIEEGYYARLYKYKFTSEELGKEKDRPKQRDDIVPYIGKEMMADRKYLKEVLQREDIPKFKSVGHKLSDHKSYFLVKRFVDIHERVEDGDFSLSFYRDLLDSGLLFETIKSIEFEELEKPRRVYDLHVPDSHLFLCNGMINHNTLLAIEASANFATEYPNGRIWYNEAEAAFDRDYAEALGMPVGRIDFIEDCFTVEEWYDHLAECIDGMEDGQEGLYILDSLDGLSDKAEQERDINKGSYGANKPKKMGELFRKLVKKLSNSRITVLIVSQERDKIGVMFGKKTTRSGGRALDFYASQVLWLRHVGYIKKTKNKIERPIGIKVEAKCEKNKIGLPFRQCGFEVIFGYGIDDAKANLDYLIEVGKYKEAGLTSEKEAKDLKKSLDKLDDDEFKEVSQRLAEAVVEAWSDVEETFLPTRRKY